MAVYTYKAKIKPREFKTGTIEADSEKSAINKLLQLNYHPIFIKIKSEKLTSRYKLFQKIGAKEIYIFMRQLSNLLEAGLPLVKALGNLSQQNSNPKIKGSISELKEKIQKGQSFSEALSSQPQFFSIFEINMIKSAETSGTLPEVITKISNLKEREIAFKNKIRSALSYPVLLLAVGIITLFVLTTFVLPKFVSLFQDLGQELPLLTQMLIGTSLFLKRFWILLILLCLIFIIGFFRYTRTDPGKFWFDKVKLDIPLFKDIIIQIETSLIARTLGTLLENGVPILNSLQIIAEIVKNKVFAQEMKFVLIQVSKGKHISEALKNSKIFDRNTLDLIAVGEESGRLEEMLFRIAQMNENESTQKIESLIFMLEPTLILVLGCIVAFIVMAILLPIFQMNFLVQ